MGKVKLSRRQFLQAAGLTGLTAITAGCSDATRKLIPFVIAPEDIVPGEATWYATTCRECPAGCGMLAKNRDGRVIKVEGNPLHPVNTGKLCARGQASVQGVYNPDRYRQPLKRLPDGKFEPIDWKEAEKIVSDALTLAARKGHGQKILFLTDLTTGSEQKMIRRFLTAVGSDNHVMYEPLAYEALRQANGDVFGERVIPAYRIDEADLLISFGANFLETWVSNVQFARQFAAFHQAGKKGKNPFFYVGPRLSMTGANADRWISVLPGGEAVVAYGLLRLLLDRNHSPALDKEDARRLRTALADFTPEFVEKNAGVKKETVNSLAAFFMKAAKPLVLAEGLGYQDLRALDTVKAANLLCSLVPGSRDTIDFSSPSALTRVARAGEMKELIDKIQGGGVDILFILRTNPAFNLPPQWNFLGALKAAPLVVSLSSFPDETGQAAHLVLPTHTFLESWGDHEPYAGVKGIMQPVMGPIFSTRLLGDILLSLGRNLKGAESFPEKDFYEVLRRSWSPAGNKTAAQPDSESAWQESLQRGGAWPATKAPSKLQTRNFKLETGSLLLNTQHLTLNTTSISLNTQQARPDDRGATVNPDALTFISYPTVQFFDGRMANRPFLQELPDPLTAITWEGWVEIHPETAGKLNIKKGDLITVRSEFGTVQAPAYPYAGIRPNTLAVPIGHGHRAFGRYARSEAGNPATVSGTGFDKATGIIRAAVNVTVTKTGQSLVLAHTDGSAFQHGRGIARAISLQELTKTATAPPDITLPLSKGFARERDFYPAHEHDAYRWSMAVDLDRCIGCGACVAACYAENNVAVVGKEQVARGREMAWLHIQRYFEQEEPYVRFLPMLCQHCDEAPCESVCPVFAPNHSKEGINNQVYNRCIGTRFCSQNCPYKVRRFNWFTWKHDSPLEWQLNPDVTVRTKGVMEKCSFCIQRINEARIRARSDGRLIRDNEFAPACVQTCPADALIFGNLKDPESCVAGLARESRAYQVLGELNTKPGVIYLKKITMQVI
jgi:anaerobic selenocysteine-containing dehydrogenase/Fe-S-cluster-containing dehydrogenase component